MWWLTVSTLLLSPAQTGPGELTVPLQSGFTCTQCHSNDDKSLASDGYAATMMRLASVDPVFRAAFEIAYQDEPALTGLCLKCHVYSGWLAGRATPSDGSALSGGDKHGVSCDACHRQMLAPPPPPDVDGGVPDGGGDFDPFSLVYENANLTIVDDQAKRGPYDDAVPNTSHDSVHDPLMSESVICAGCHQVSNATPRKDPDTEEVIGPAVPEQRTFTEWLQSDFAGPGGQSCQACHMPATPGKITRQEEGPDRERHDHTLVGGNTVVPLMVSHLPASERPDELANIAEAAAVTVQRSRDFLMEEACDLDVAGIDIAGGTARVRVTNKSGHKLPTGYAEGRRMWLEHRVTAADGTAGPWTGKPDPVTFDFETGKDPLVVWEILLGQGSDEKSFRFLLADRIIKDNRIPPAGFRPDDETAPVRYTFEDLGGGTLAHWDDVALPLGEAGCFPRRLQATVHYQVASGEYYRFLRDNAPGFGDTLEAAWNAAGGAVPVPLAEVDVWVDADGTVTAYDGPRACGAGPADAGPAPDASVVGGDDAGVAEPEPTPEPEAPTGDGCACGAHQGTLARAGLPLLGLGLLRLRRRRARG